MYSQNFVFQTHAFSSPFTGVTRVRPICCNSDCKPTVAYVAAWKFLVLQKSSDISSKRVLPWPDAKLLPGHGIKLQQVVGLQFGDSAFSVKLIYFSTIIVTRTLWPSVVTPDKAPAMHQIVSLKVLTKLFSHKSRRSWYRPGCRSAGWETFLRSGQGRLQKKICEGHKDWSERTLDMITKFYLSTSKSSYLTSRFPQAGAYLPLG